jgi:hypothetical protein
MGAILVSSDSLDLREAQWHPTHHLILGKRPSIPLELEGKAPHTAHPSPDLLDMPKRTHLQRSTASSPRPYCDLIPYFKGFAAIETNRRTG